MQIQAEVADVTQAENDSVKLDAGCDFIDNGVSDGVMDRKKKFLNNPGDACGKMTTSEKEK